MSKLKDAFTQQKKQTEQYNQPLFGMMGIVLGGQKVVEVPNRNAYVYVRLRNSQSEVIQVYNNKVAPSYNLPVKLERQGNRYVILDVDTTRYDNNWSSYSPYLARHGNTHSFDLETGGGGDVVWVHGRQFMPLLAFPSGSIGSPNAIVAPYILRNDNGTWKYVGNTGTASFTPYNPPNSGTAVMGLIVLDTNSGNPYLIIGSGSTFSDTITGTSQIYSYIPPLTNPRDIPIAAVRLVSGTSRLTWDNLYDVRQFVHPITTGSGGGISSVAVTDEGASQGNATTFDFVGNTISVTISGSVARVFVTGSAGGSFTGNPSGVVLTNDAGNLITPDWLTWSQSSRPYLEFGANVPGKEVNAGKMGYGSFGNDFEFNIIGAGTGSNRKVRIDDDLIVSDTSEARIFNVTDPAGGYLVTGSPHQHPVNTGSIVVMDEGAIQGSAYALNFVGGVNASVSGSVARVYLTREVLSAARTYYVRTDGSDSNDGLSNTAGGAFLTIQKAVDTVANLDKSIYDVTIQVADGTYTTPIVLKTTVGAGTASIIGNTTTPANVIVSTTSNNAISADGAVGVWIIKGLKLTTTTTGFGMFIVNAPTTVKIQNMDFGTMATGYAHMIAGDGATIQITGNYNITGAAGRHLYASQLGKIIYAAASTVTLTGTPAITIFALADRMSLISTSAVPTYSGSATGQRYLVQLNSVIYTGGGGANFFPGNSAGASASGGQYA